MEVAWAAPCWPSWFPARPRPVDDDFRALWNNVQILLLRVGRQFESSFTASLPLIDELAGKERPDRADLRRLRGSMPHSVVALERFFERAGPGWFPLLRSKGYLRDPPPLEVAADETIAYVRWPAGRYLVRMATEPRVQRQVIEVALALETDNPQAHECVAEAALALPAVGMRTRRPRPAPVPRSAFAGFRFPPDVIVLAVRWYLRFGLSYRDVEELLVERGVQVDHVTIHRWVLRFTPLLAEAARPCRRLVGDRWQVDETYVKVAGQWRYVYRAVDQFGQVIDVFVSPRRDGESARRFFQQAIGATKVRPAEVTTDQAPVYPAVLEDLLPAAWHCTDQYANNRVECDHGRLKARLKPMRGLKQDRSARVIIAGHALVQNVRRGHYELAVEEPATRRLAVAFEELAVAI